MPKIAIDVVLLPDSSMTGQAVDISRRLSKKSNGKILLNKETCLPHISLAMGVIDRDDTPHVSGILRDLSARFTVFNLLAESFRAEKIPSGETVSMFVIEKSPALQSLHETVMDDLAKFLSYDVSTSMLFSPPPVEEISLYWIKSYATKSSFNNFNPHITLGFGELPDIRTPIAFTASHLALCHLGNYCTCRRTLFSQTLTR
jgi:hypothetical protein